MMKLYRFSIASGHPPDGVCLTAFGDWRLLLAIFPHIYEIVKRETVLSVAVGLDVDILLLLFLTCIL